MVLRHIALVSETPVIAAAEVARVAAALQRQVTRDLGPLWGIDATVSYFPSLEDVPMGYWPIIVTLRDLGEAAGVHLDDHGQPYALVEATEAWSLAASHECIEMLVDPSGNRLVACQLPGDSSKRVEILVEACDPCQDEAHGYTIDDGVLVSDFCTPAYYEPGAGPGVRYSYRGTITAARQVLRDGYLTWHDPVTDEWFQQRGPSEDSQPASLGKLARGDRSLRGMINAVTPDHLKPVTGAKLSLAVREAATQASQASRARAQRLSAVVSSLGRAPFAAPSAEAPAAKSPAEVADAIRASVEKIARRPELPQQARVVAALQSALSRVGHELEAPLALPADPEGEYHLALVKAALAAPRVEVDPRLQQDLIGFHQYEDLDIRWVGTVWEDIVKSKVPFPPPTRPEALIVDIPDTVSIALAGDWGTGDESSKRIAREMAKLEPQITIHLGDVYYTGSPADETRTLIADWPAGSLGSFTLNSNHEMYGGAQGYFGTALTHPKFKQQRGYSYFALRNEGWIILGLDTAYAATHFYDQGALNEQQKQWLDQLVRGGHIGERNVIVLSHHQGRELDGRYVKPLWDDVCNSLGQAPHYWYWGHVHGVGVFKPVTIGTGDSAVEFKGRLVGHGGVPYGPDQKSEAVEWLETELAGDHEIPKRALNGFALITLGEDGLDEKLYSEHGLLRWQT